MGPLLSQEQYGPAIAAGVRALTGIIARGYGVTDSTLAAAPLPVGGAPGARRTVHVVPAHPALHPVRDPGQPGRSPAPGILGWRTLDRWGRVGRWGLGRRWVRRGRRRVRWLRRWGRVQRWRLGGTLLMHDSVDRVVTPFLAAADAALGAGYSALLYGSAARGDYIAGRSDINLMLVLDDPSPGAPASAGSGVRHVAQGDGRAAAPDQPGGVGPRERRLPHRDHRHAGGLPRASRGRPSRRRAGAAPRSAPGARARASRQAAPAAPGLRSRGGRRPSFWGSSRPEAPRRSWCCCVRS